MDQLLVGLHIGISSDGVQKNGEQVGSSCTVFEAELRNCSWPKRPGCDYFNYIRDMSMLHAIWPFAFEHAITGQGNAAWSVEGLEGSK